MLSRLWLGLRELISVSPCPRCRRPLPAQAASASLCADCQQELKLSRAGLQGHQPLHWWSLGWYDADLRRLLLQLRPDPRPALIAALADQLSHRLACNLSWQERTGARGPVLVAIPSWKRRSNPLPERLCQALERSLGGQQRQLLQRSRATLGQHHLPRALRLSNQRGSFTVTDRAPGRAPAVVLVDDILTSGATAQAAAEALAAGGWPVAGLLCLARTPRRRPAGPWAMV